MPPFPAEILLRQPCKMKRRLCETTSVTGEKRDQIQEWKLRIEADTAAPFRQPTHTVIMIFRTAVRILLPFVSSWAAKQEAIILRDGVTLNDSQVADARSIGIAHPERVRVLVVPRIPLPLHPLLQSAAEKFGLLSPHTSGMSLRYGIFIRTDCRGDRRLVVHELAHTAQYERLGGFRPFLMAYLHECITPPGYPFGPLEQEAVRIAQQTCG